VRLPSGATSDYWSHVRTSPDEASSRAPTHSSRGGKSTTRRGFLLPCPSAAGCNGAPLGWQVPQMFACKRAGERRNGPRTGASVVSVALGAPPFPLPYRCCLCCERGSVRLRSAEGRRRGEARQTRLWGFGSVRLCVRCWRGGVQACSQVTRFPAKSPVRHTA
jgi:hypothetical protein